MYYDKKKTKISYFDWYLATLHKHAFGIKDDTLRCMIT